MGIAKLLYSGEVNVRDIGYFLLFSFIFILFSIFLYKNSSIFNSHQDIDSKAYLHRANILFKTGSIIDTQNSQDCPYYALGYSFFIYFIYKFLGQNNFYIILIQVLLSLLSGFLIFKITENLFNKNIGLIAFFLFSINLGFLIFSQFILTEILLSFLLILFVYFFVKFIKNSRELELIFSAFFMGISICVKPAAIYFIFFIFLYFIIFFNFKKFLKLSLIFGFVFYSIILGYMLFNKISFNSFSIAPLAKENLYFYLLPKVLAIKNSSSEIEEQKFLASKLSGSKFIDNSWQELKDIFIKNLKESPQIFIYVWTQNVIKTFLGLYTSNLKILIEHKDKSVNLSYFKQEGNFFYKLKNYILGNTNNYFVKLTGLLEFFYTILRYIFILIALWALRNKPKILYFFILYILYFSIITGHDGCARFRMMFEPVLIILTAFGLFNFGKNLYKFRSE